MNGADPDPTVRLTARGILIDDVQWLTSFRQSPQDIATHLRKTPAALARTLYRAGRPDLAKPFARLDKTNRTVRRHTA